MHPCAGNSVEKLEGYPLGELLGADGGSEIGASDGMPGENVSIKRELITIEESLGISGGTYT